MKKIIKSKKVQPAIGPYSHAIERGPMLFVSGQLPINPETGEMPDGIEAQTRQALDNMRSVLNDAGYDMKDVVKTTVLLKDIADFNAMNEVYATYFTDVAPARVCYQVAALPKGALVEIDAIAANWFIHKVVV